jgi:hypothetical protein
VLARQRAESTPRPPLIIQISTIFSARLDEFGSRLTDVQKALYLGAIGLLRARHASSIS